MVFRARFCTQRQVVLGHAHQLLANVVIPLKLMVALLIAFRLRKGRGVVKLFGGNGGGQRGVGRGVESGAGREGRGHRQQSTVRCGHLVKRGIVSGGGRGTGGC